MKKSIIILFLSLFSLLSAKWIDLDARADLFESQTQNYQQTTIDFNLDGYELEITRQDNRNFSKISYLNEGQTTEEGKPNLPRFTRMIIIPDQGTPEYEIISKQSQIISDINVSPFQGFQSESNRDSEDFKFDEKFYQSNSSYPQSLVEIGDAMIMRDCRVVPVSINPFIYNAQAKELEIITSISLEINIADEVGANPKLSNRKKSRMFSAMYESLLNYDSNNRTEEYQQPSYLIISTNDATIEEMTQQLVRWKTQKGFLVNYVTTAETGTYVSGIKSYIQNAYDNWQNPPEFVCLIGDANGSYGIPTGSHSGGEGDQVYTLLEGDDILADVAIGRLSFQSTTDYQTILNKILQYEKNPYMGETDWYEKASFTGDPSTSGPSCVYTKTQIRDKILLDHPDFEITEHYSGNYTTNMTNDLNDGVGYFNYRGYYGMSGFGTSNINQLQNSSKLTVAVLLTCGVGSFSQDNECRSEAFLRHGTPNNLKGGVAAIATATIHTHTCFNNIVDFGIFSSIFSDKNYYLGNALNNGKLALVQNYPNNPGDKVYDFSYWNNLMGDPALEVWTSTPKTMIAEYDEEITVGQNYLEIHVTDQFNGDIESAWVTFSQGNDIISSNWTDENGHIILPISDIDVQEELELVITKHDFIPHTHTFTLEENQGIHITDYEIIESNETAGINPGEDIELNFSLKNYSTEAINISSATLSCSNSDVVVSVGVTPYPVIQPGEVESQISNFEITVPTNILSDEDLEFELLIIDSEENEFIELAILDVDAPLFEIDEIEINGSQDYIDAGETGNINISLRNLGTIAAGGVSAELSTENNLIEITDNFSSFGNISAGGLVSNNQNTFEISVSSSIVTGDYVDFVMDVFSTDGPSQQIPIRINIGDADVNDPLGRDVYGYYCFDDEDEGYTDMPEYDWIDISSTGINLNFSDSGDEGDIEVVDLPIEFSFYGETYEELTICSNGWIAPGIEESGSFMNWTIPNAGGPKPIIGVFWDDLKTTYGNVYYQYFSDENYFVIQWENMRSDYDNSTETFQVILYDLMQYPSMTGDSNIKMQYEEINNVDYGVYDSWSVNHGQYATVGIADPTGQIGLEYTFNNEYPVAAKPLEDEMAIFFTTSTIVQEEPFIWAQTNQLSYDDVYFGSVITDEIMIRNYGQNPLEIEDVIVTGEFFSVDYNENQDVGFCEELIITVTYNPESVGNHSGSIQIISNATNSPFVISLHASCIYAGAVETVAGLNETLPTATNYTQNLPLENSGMGELIYNLSVNYPDRAEYVQNRIEYQAIADKNEMQIGKGNNQRDSGGPDNFGYEWIDSNEAGGPEYIWNDIAGIGTEINYYSDDEMSSMLDLGFNFDFYGNSYSQVKVCSNGFLTFTSSNTDWDNSNIPNSSGPNNMIAPFWDDMSPQNSGNVYYYADQANQTFTVQFSDAPHYPGQYNGTYTFQAVLHSNGTIYFYYNSMNGDLSTNSIGIENENGNDGLQVAYNETYIESEMAIRLSAYNYWLNVQETSGVINPGEIASIPIEFSTDGLDIGDYFCQLIVTTNDPENQEFEIPIDMSITDEEFVELYINVISENDADIQAAKITFTDVNTDENFVVWTDENGEAIRLNPTGTYDILVEREGFVAILEYDVEILADQELSYIMTTVDNIEDGDSSQPIMLGNNYPNPFNPETTISYSIPNDTDLKIEIFNIRGQKIKTLVDDIVVAGNYQVTWNGKDKHGKSVSSGVYYYRMQTADITKAKKMLLLK